MNRISIMLLIVLCHFFTAYAQKGRIVENFDVGGLEKTIAVH
jgi:hypothetical protein